MFLFVWVVLCSCLFGWFHVFVCLGGFMFSFVWVVLCFCLFGWFYVFVCLGGFMFSFVWVVLCFRLFGWFYVFVCLGGFMFSFVWVVLMFLFVWVVLFFCLFGWFHVFVCLGGLMFGWFVFIKSQVMYDFLYILVQERSQQNKIRAQNKHKLLGKIALNIPRKVKKLQRCFSCVKLKHIFTNVNLNISVSYSLWGER